VKATGMYAIAWVALFVFSGGMYCAPPRTVMVRDDRRGYSRDEEVRPARGMTILHRWNDDETVYDDAGFDASEPFEGYDDGADLQDEDRGRQTRRGEDEIVPGRAKNERPGIVRTAPGKDSSPAGDSLRKSVKDRTTPVITYTVKKNDTLYSLAKRHDCTLAEIYGLNDLKKGEPIKVGTKLRLPSNSTRQTARTPVTAPTPARERIDFRWPLPRVIAVRRDSTRGVKPLGLEITSSPGSTVVSSASGVVKRIGDMRGYGRYVIISHDERFITVYSRMGEISVREGERISAGRVIGKIDDGSRSIHFQIGRAGKPVDPLRYLPGRS